MEARLWCKIMRFTLPFSASSSTLYAHYLNVAPYAPLECRLYAKLTANEIDWNASSEFICNDLTNDRRIDLIPFPIRTQLWPILFTYAASTTDDIFRIVNAKHAPTNAQPSNRPTAVINHFHSVLSSFLLFLHISLLRLAALLGFSPFIWIWAFFDFHMNKYGDDNQQNKHKSGHETKRGKK